MAKAKTKAAVKRKPAKAPARAASAAPAKAAKREAAAKPVKKAAKTSVAAKTATAKIAPNVAAAPKQAAKPIVAPNVERPPPTAVKLTAPAKPVPALQRGADAPRADLPPPAGFALLVDGHFKNQFEDLKRARDAASELKSRFPMLRIEIYDAANKARLPA